MQALHRAAQRLGTAARSLSTLCGQAAGGWAAPLLACGPALEACSRPGAAGLPWAAVAAARQQPVSLSQGIAAAGLVPLPTPAAGGLVAPQQGGLLRQLEQLWADSVRRKRKRAMNKHKHRKRRKLNRMRK